MKWSHCHRFVDVETVLGNLKGGSSLEDAPERGSLRFPSNICFVIFCLWSHLLTQLTINIFCNTAQNVTCLWTITLIHLSPLLIFKATRHTRVKTINATIRNNSVPIQTSYKQVNYVYLVTLADILNLISCKMEVMKNS